MRDVNSTLVFAAVVIAGCVAMMLLGGCHDNATYGVTCYDHGHAILDTQASRIARWSQRDGELVFTEAHTGKKFWVTKGCVIVREAQ
jgi:predicted transglutaminase-like cysteine proteinase